MSGLKDLERRFYNADLRRQLGAWRIAVWGPPCPLEATASAGNGGAQRGGTQSPDWLPQESSDSGESAL